MKHFDKLKSVLRSEETPLPDELSWENMKGDILGENAKIQSAFRRFGMSKSKLTSILLFLGIGLSAALYYSKGTSKIEDQPQSTYNSMPR